MTEENEQRLKSLLDTIDRPNRNRLAKEWKERGGVVFGLVCHYIPEEILSAASVLPWRVAVSAGTVDSKAILYRPNTTNPYYRKVLEGVFTSEIDFLHGFVVSNRDDDCRRLFDVLERVDEKLCNHIVFVPAHNSGTAVRMFADSLHSLADWLGTHMGQPISAERLREAIAVHNLTRSLIRQVYELRKRDSPPLSGAEMLRLTLAATVLPKTVFNEELQTLLPYIRDRKLELKATVPRLMISSDMLDKPEYVELIEQAGSLVAMDDLDTGSRYVNQLVDERTVDPYQALAERYLAGPACPRMFSWDDQIQQIVRWCHEFGIHGVVEMPQICDFSRGFRHPFVIQKLKEAHIPLISIERDYTLANAGQIATRIGAFIEMLDSQVAKS